MGDIMEKCKTCIHKGGDCGMPVCFEESKQ